MTTAMATGNPYFIHVTKVMDMLLASSAEIAMALGGEPTGVPIPPTAAAVAIPSTIAFA